MQTKTCTECGAEFTPKHGHPNQKYCSHECARSCWKRLDAERYRRSSALRDVEHAMRVSAPVANETLMRAARKPENTSAVRWRIELRRRANPLRYMATGNI